MTDEAKAMTTSSPAVELDPKWEEPKPGVKTFTVRVWVSKETCLMCAMDCLGATPRKCLSQSYMAVAADLPGCVSEGGTFDGAIANIREAFVGCALTYLENGGKIPWKDGGPRPLFHEEPRLTIEVPK